jgi:hypothetical protein
MSLITNLPEPLFSLGLASWLTILDVARLDSALCNRAQREKFLRTAFQTPLSMPSTSMSIVLTNRINEWVFQKNIPVAGLQATTGFTGSHTRRCAYLSQYGHGIRWIEYSGSSISIGSQTRIRLSVFDVAKYCPNLIRLNVGEFDLGVSLIEVVKNCTCLTELTVRGIQNPSEKITHLHIASESLRRVELFNMALEEARLISLVRRNRGLRSFGTSAPGATLAFQRELALNCRGLQDVQLHCVDVTETSIYFLLTQCAHLRSLTLKGCFWYPP